MYNNFLAHQFTTADNQQLLFTCVCVIALTVDCIFVVAGSSQSNSGSRQLSSAPGLLCVSTLKATIISRYLI